MRIAAVVVMATLLAGCETEAQLRQQAEALDAQEDATCKSWGAKPGTDGYTQCRMKLAEMDEQRRIAAVQSMRFDMPKLEMPASPKPANRQSCTSQRVGNTVQTDCY